MAWRRTHNMLSIVEKLHDRGSFVQDINNMSYTGKNYMSKHFARGLYISMRYETPPHPAMLHGYRWPAFKPEQSNYISIYIAWM